MKIILLFMLILCIVPLFADADAVPWIDISLSKDILGDYYKGTTWVGIDFFGVFKDIKTHSLLYSNSLYGFSVWVKYDTMMQFGSLTEWYPWSDAYTLGAKITIGPMYISVDHTCTHIVSSYATPKYEYFTPDTTNITAGFRFFNDRPLW